jgi:hypothetical protein
MDQSIENGEFIELIFTKAVFALIVAIRTRIETRNDYGFGVKAIIASLVLNDVRCLSFTKSNKVYEKSLYK